MIKLNKVNTVVRQVKQVPTYLAPKAISYEPGSMNLPALPPLAPKFQKALIFLNNMISSVIH